VVEDVDLPGRGVDVVGARAVGGEGQPVGDRDAVQHLLDGQVGREPVQRAGALALVVGHRAAPEVARGVGTALVHPDARVVPEVAQAPLDLQVGVEEHETALVGEHDPAAAAGPEGSRDGADMRAADHVGAHQLEYVAGVHVDPAHPVEARVPHRPLAVVRGSG
jgi:hypothetical protein